LYQPPATGRYPEDFSMLLHALPLRLMQIVADTPAITFALVIALLGLIYLLVQTRRVLAMDNGNQVMQEIAAAIQEGAAAFLNREYTFLGGFVVVAFATGPAVPVARMMGMGGHTDCPGCVAECCCGPAVAISGP